MKYVVSVLFCYYAQSNFKIFFSLFTICLIILANNAFSDLNWIYLFVSFCCLSELHNSESFCVVFGNNGLKVQGSPCVFIYGMSKVQKRRKQGSISWIRNVSLNRATSRFWMFLEKGCLKLSEEWPVNYKDQAQVRCPAVWWCLCHLFLTCEYLCAKRLKLNRCWCDTIPLKWSHFDWKYFSVFIELQKMVSMVTRSRPGSAGLHLERPIGTTLSTTGAQTPQRKLRWEMLSRPETSGPSLGPWSWKRPWGTKSFWTVLQIKFYKFEIWESE